MAIKRAPENKMIGAAPANKAVQEPGLLMGAHGRRVCSCGTETANCGHLGHAYQTTVIERSCHDCAGG